jgi:hypothetical protein
MGCHRLLVEFLGLSRLNRKSALRTFADTSPQAVTVTILDNHGPAFSNFDGTLDTSDDAIAAAIALFLIYLDNVSHCHNAPPLIFGLDDHRVRRERSEGLDVSQQMTKHPRFPSPGKLTGRPGLTSKLSRNPSPDNGRGLEVLGEPVMLCGVPIRESAR